MAGYEKSKKVRLRSEMRYAFVDEGECEPSKIMENGWHQFAPRDWNKFIDNITVL